MKSTQSPESDPRILHLFSIGTLKPPSEISLSLPLKTFKPFTNIRRFFNEQGFVSDGFHIQKQ